MAGHVKLDRAAREEAVGVSKKLSIVWCIGAITPEFRGLGLDHLQRSAEM